MDICEHVEAFLRSPVGRAASGKAGGGILLVKMNVCTSLFLDYLFQILRKANGRI